MLDQAIELNFKHNMPQAAYHKFIFGKPFTLID